MNLPDLIVYGEGGITHIIEGEAAYQGAVTAVTTDATVSYELNGKLVFQPRPFAQVLKKDGATPIGATKAEVLTYNKDNINFRSAVPAESGTWERPAGYLVLPEVLPSENKIYLLINVYPDIPGEAVIQSGKSVDIDWGDGSAIINGNGGISYLKNYDYNLMTSPIIQDELDRNCKQAIATVTLTNENTSQWTLYLDRSLTSNFNPLPWIDISIASDKFMYFNLGNLGECKRLRRLDINIPALETLYAIGTSTVEEYNFHSSLENLNTGSSTFYGAKINNFVVDKFKTIGGGGASAFRDSTLKSIKVFETPDATNLNLCFFDAVDLIEVKMIIAPNLVNMQQFAQTATALQEMYFQDCSLVKNTANAFSVANALSKLIMPGLTVGLSLRYCNFSSDAINAFLTACGNADIAYGTTFDFRDNPGSGSADATIGTAKGFTVLLI